MNTKTLDRLSAYLDDDSRALLKKYGDRLYEIRIRVNRPIQLIGADGIDEFGKKEIEQELLKKILASMMNFSIYAREEEIRQGYFTMPDGCRVGICGKAAIKNGSIVGISQIGSICIRIAREIPGSGEAFIPYILQEKNISSILIASNPGLGKTTCLRDIARLLSEAGYRVGIADERHEIAACYNGIPTVNIGIRTDVMDGCPKWIAIGQMIRAMAPQIIITDEIGSKEDVQALADAKRSGIAIAASVHAGNIDDLRRREYIREIIAENVFSTIVLLDVKPGNIKEIHQLTS